MSDRSQLSQVLRNMSLTNRSSKPFSHPIVVPKPATTFELFPNLAPELRLKIWAEACLPRTVTIRYLPTLDKCVTSSLPPAILQVSHEAREAAIRVYSLAFGTRTRPARIYFNPHRDTLYLPRHMAMGYDETLRDFRSFIADPEGLLDEVTSLAIDHVDVEVKRPWESYNKASLVRGFKRLEEVIVVLCQNEGAWKLGRAKIAKFVNPKEQVEEVLRFWVDFRQTFMIEERGLEDVSRQVGREYESFELPTVKIRDKVLIDRRRH